MKCITHKRGTEVVMMGKEGGKIGACCQPHIFALQNSHLIYCSSVITGTPPRFHADTSTHPLVHTLLLSIKGTENKNFVGTYLELFLLNSPFQAFCSPITVSITLWRLKGDIRIQTHARGWHESKQIPRFRLPPFNSQKVPRLANTFIPIGRAEEWGYKGHIFLNEEG